MNSQKRKNKQDEGYALLAVLIISIFVVGIVGVISTRSVWDDQHTRSYLNTMRAAEASSSGLEFASIQLFGPTAVLPVFGGQVYDVPGAYQVLSNGAQIDEVKVSAIGSTFVMESTGSSGGVTVTSVTGGSTGGLQTFPGFEYAVLANNINCIMCHASFDSVERANNTDPSLYGTFSRIKIASLESLLVRVGKADSALTGSYYTRGVITDKSGNPLTDLVGTTVTGFNIDEFGNMVEDAITGEMTLHELAVAGRDVDTGLYNPNEYLYTDYPTDAAEMTDGDLPLEFPAIIPDLNGNKVVDPAELESIVAKYGTGSILGGVAFGVSPGTSYANTAGANMSGVPTTSNGAATDLGDGRYDGNVFLIGTDVDPILISGPVFVDGDIVIQGPVEGSGNIFATGNIYFTGDTTYNDTGGSFGLNDGSNAGVSTENIVSYAAGGNIQIGDYLALKKVGGNNYDVLSAEALTAASIDTGGPPNSGLESGFTMSEVTLFNKIEYQKSQANPSYIPRYYQLRDGDPIYRFTNDAKEHGNTYDEFFTEITAGELTAAGNGEGAAILSLAPQNEGGAPWLSELYLKQVWQNTEVAREPGQAFQIDGLIYTNNSIFALARSKGKHNSNAYGQLKIRGGMVAADLGILAAGAKAKNTSSAILDIMGITEAGQGRGFVMEYDQRVANHLQVGEATDDGSSNTYTRSIRVFINL